MTIFFKSNIFYFIILLTVNILMYFAFKKYFEFDFLFFFIPLIFSLVTNYFIILSSKKIKYINKILPFLFIFSFSLFIVLLDTHTLRLPNDKIVIHGNIKEKWKDELAQEGSKLILYENHHEVGRVWENNILYKNILVSLYILNIIIVGLYLTLLFKRKLRVSIGVTPSVFPYLNEQLELLSSKKTFLEKELIITYDSEKKFALQEQIKELENKILKLK